jgi:hypothetical protein
MPTYIVPDEGEWVRRNRNSGVAAWLDTLLRVLEWGSGVIRGRAFAVNRRTAIIADPESEGWWVLGDGRFTPARIHFAGVQFPTVARQSRVAWQVVFAPQFVRIMTRRYGFATRRKRVK